MRIERLLVIKIRALGDTLLATPSLRALRFGFPQAHLTALVSTAGAEVLKGNPDINELLVYDKSRAGVGYSLGLMRDLASRRFDAVVALHASFRTALLARATGAPVRVVHNHSGADYFSTVQIPARKESKSAIERDLDAVRALGLTITNQELVFVLSNENMNQAKDFLKSQGIQNGHYLVLAPGSNSQERRWPIERTVEFINILRNKTPTKIVLLAGPQETEMILKMSGLMENIAPVFRGSIQTAAAIIKLSSGMITSNSGPKHVAVAVGTPTLTLWTNEPEAEWHPYDLKKHVLLRSASGRIEDIKVEDVVEMTIKHFKIR